MPGGLYEHQKTFLSWAESKPVSGTEPVISDCQWGKMIGVSMLATW